MLWTHASVIVTPFQGNTLVDLSVPCTFDFNVAAAKYFAGLEDGEVPLNLMFSGTVFYAATDGALQVEQIPWDREAKYRLPVQVWKEMMENVLPEQRLALFTQGCFRPAQSVQNAPRDSDVGTNAR